MGKASMFFTVTCTVLPYMDTVIIRQKKSKQIFNNNVVVFQGNIVEILKVSIFIITLI